MRLRPFRFRIRTLMAVVLVLALWLAAGIAMVRASVTQKQKETAVLVVVLVPLGAVANSVILGALERRYVDPMFLPRTNGCPECGAPLPNIRVPRNFRQAFWGGFTCRGCGCETDRRGAKV